MHWILLIFNNKLFIRRGFSVAAPPELKMITGPNTQDAFHFSLFYIRGTLASILARWRISLWLTGYILYPGGGGP